MVLFAMAAILAVAVVHATAQSTNTILTTDQCGRIAEQTGLIPYVKRGSTSDLVKKQWDDSGCDQKMCQYWKDRYNIKPFVSIRSFPVRFRDSWGRSEMQCNYRVGPYSNAQCTRLSEDLGLIPYITWGATPEYAKSLWDNARCNQKMCQHWATKYNIKPFESWGWMPEEFKGSWDHPEMNCNSRV